MDEMYVAQFISTYFVDVKQVEFFPFRNTRQILIGFPDEKSYNMNMNSEKLQIMKDLFLMDGERLEVMVDRDKFETVMFLTAVQGSITGQIKEYAKENEPVVDDEIVTKVMREMEKEKEKNNESKTVDG